jgi:membrane protein DedA with SNARE-associated domain
VAYASACSETAAPRLARVTHLLLTYGLALLFGLVAIESSGVPLPGETALIAAAVLASQGHYSIAAVIAVAAAGAIVGDNIGYWLGRKGGRALLTRVPVVRDHFERVLPAAEQFFQRHGSKTIFLARFFAILRVTAAWVAGISGMPWWRFLLWNAAGGIVWAILVGLVAFEVGKAAADAISRYGLYAGVAVAVLVVVAVVVARFWRPRWLNQVRGRPDKTA